MIRMAIEWLDLIALVIRDVMGQSLVVVSRCSMMRLEDRTGIAE